MTTTRRLTVSALIVVSIVLITPRHAVACSCVPGTDRQHYAAADLVFVGVARSVEDLAESASNGYDLAWTFDVASVQKGEPRERIQVRTPAGEASCGPDFTEGSRYQVFARDAEQPTTDLCSGTRLLAADVEPYEPSPPLGLIIGAVGGALVLAWSFRRLRETRVPLDPGPPRPMD